MPKVKYLVANCTRPQIQVQFSVIFSATKSNRKLFYPLKEKLCSSTFLPTSMILLKDILPELLC